MLGVLQAFNSQNKPGCWLLGVGFFGFECWAFCKHSKPKHPGVLDVLV